MARATTTRTTLATTTAAPVATTTAAPVAVAGAMVQGTTTAPAASATATTTNTPALLAYVVVAVQIRTTGAGASVARKAAGYAVGNTVQACRAAGITAADIQWDMPRGNVVLAAPNTPAALAALAVAAGNGTPAHSATIAAALPALLAAQKAAFAPRGSKLPAPVV